MKLRAYIALFLGVLVLSLPIATYANIQTQTCEMACCANTKTDNDCKNKKEDSKDCCGSKSNCNCMVSVACSAFVLQESSWTLKSVLPLVISKYELFAFQLPKSISSSIWQPPKF